MTAMSGDFTDIKGLIPEPWRILGCWVVDELLAGAGCGHIQQLHCILRRRVFVFRKTRKAQITDWPDAETAAHREKSLPTSGAEISLRQDAGALLPHNYQRPVSPLLPNQ